MRIQQVINIVVNDRQQDFAHSLSGLERVCAYVPGKHMHASPSTFSGYVQPQDIVVATTKPTVHPLLSLTALMLRIRARLLT